MTVEVLDGGSGGRDAEVASATVEMGSPFVCSMVVAMPRRRVRGARRRVASRSAMFGGGESACGCGDAECLNCGPALCERGSEGGVAGIACASRVDDGNAEGWLKDRGSTAPGSYAAHAAELKQDPLGAEFEYTVRELFGLVSR